MNRDVESSRRSTRLAGSARSSSAGVVIVLAVISLMASTALSFIPQVDRTMKEIARVNRASGRAKAIQLDLTMRVADRTPIASAELISHPSGLARLEIRGYRGGRVDRYLLSGAELIAAKDGRPLERPQPMLQPFFLLQPSSETTLRAALETFGVQTQWIGLAPCGEQDCFVIGDPRLAAPLPEPVVPMTSEEADVLDDPLENPSDEADANPDGSSAILLEDGVYNPVGRGDELSGPILALPEDGLIPRLWVDTQELQVRRIDRASGVFVVFGPIVSFEKLKLPAWFEIHDPGAPTVRFEVDRAVAVNAPPKAFSRKWLLGPIDPSDPGPASLSEPGFARDGPFRSQP